MQKLSRDFFARDTCQVAEALLGKLLVFHDKQVIINETEAYHGFDDPASHAYRGKTNRTAVMFGEAGFSYVYLIYGMYHCLNVVTMHADFPAAVLIRGGWVLNQDGLVAENLNGPGKLCRALGIDKSQNQIDLIDNTEFYFAEAGLHPECVLTPRIGIKQGLDKHWRYVVSGQYMELIKIK